MRNSNLLVLVICQMISATGSIVFVTLGGIIGSTLSTNPAWATLPISMMVIAVAITTVPATMLMRRVGRSRGFAMASISAVVAVLVASEALATRSFVLFIVATMMLGINLAFTHQYRYAAAESVSSRYTARAISFVLLGAIGGAFIGPELAIRGQHWVDGVPYAGSMYALAVLYCLQALLFLRLRGVEFAHVHDAPQSDRKLGVARMMFAGAFTLLITSVVGLQGQSVLHYWWALVLLGVGWNFLYVGGTTMLTYTYSVAERFRAQAINEFLVFGTSATASLLAGTVMHYFGWPRLMLIPIPILVIVCVALLFVRRDRTLQRVETT